MKTALSLIALLGWFPALAAVAIADSRTPQTCRTNADIAISGRIAIYKSCKGTIINHYGEGRFVRYATREETADYYGY